MPKVFGRSLWIFTVVTGIWAVVMLLKLLLSYFWPTAGFAPYPSLPEDVWLVAGSSFFSDMAHAFPGLFLSTVILAFSFVLKPSDFPQDAGRLPGARTISQVSAFLAFGSSFLAFLVLFSEPSLHAFLQEEMYKVRQTSALENAYLNVKSKDDKEVDPTQKQTYENEEAALLQRLLTLRPQQRFHTAGSPFDYEFEYQIVRSHRELEQFFMSRLLPGSETPQPEDKLPVEGLLELARTLEKVPAYNRDDYRVNHLAYQVFLRLINAEDQGMKINPETLKEASGLIDASWQDIRDRTLSADERLRASYFFRKGKSLGDFQFKNYLEAFYGFQELQRENPKDAEVSRYEALSLENLKDSVLFVENLDVLFQVPGWDNLTFRNPSPELPQSDPNVIEIVRIGRLLDTSQGTFVKNFEVFRYRKDGTVLLHWTAPYGQWKDGKVTFNVWRRSRPETFFPVVATQVEGNHLYGDGDVTPPAYPLKLNVNDLAFLAQKELPQSLKTFDLLADSRALEILGASSVPWQTEFLYRVSTPLAFLTLCFATFFFAWLLRSRVTEKMPLLWRSLVVILPFAANAFIEVSSWATRLALAMLLEKFGFWSALFGMAAFSLLTTMGFLVASFVEISRHRLRGA